MREESEGWKRVREESQVEGQGPGHAEPLGLGYTSRAVVNRKQGRAIIDLTFPQKLLSVPCEEWIAGKEGKGD